MFKMKNPIGSAVIIARTERRRDELLSRGFTLVEEKAEVSLNKMKVEDLEKFAKEKGIDLSDCANKNEKLEKIKKSIAE